MSTAVLVMANALAARDAVQVLQCGGLECTTMAHPADLVALTDKEPPAMVCSRLADFPAVLGGCEARSATTRFFVYLDEADHQALATAASTPQLTGMFGLRYPGAPPRGWELLSVARRLAAPRGRWAERFHSRRPTSSFGGRA